MSLQSSSRRDFSHFVANDAEAAQMILAVEGIACAGCIGRIEAAVRALPAVIDARINFTTKRLSVSWRPGAEDAPALIETLERLGYRAYPFEPRRVEGEELRYGKRLLMCLAVAGFAAMNIMLLSVSVWSGNVSDITPETRDFFHWLSALIALPAAAFSGQPFFRSAICALRARRVNMDVPISLGIVLALGMSVVETINHAEHAYFDSAVMLIFFLLCGRYLDHAMRQRTRQVAGNLAALKAETARRLDEGDGQSVVPCSALLSGDRVMVLAGERVPADGVVLTGTSELDESVITGETALKRVSVGAQIYAGSLNHAGVLVMRVERGGLGTLLDQIEQLLERATQARSRYVQLADRAARFYAPVVHTAAALTAVGWLAAGAGWHDAIVTAISVVIITCPCALALAVPAVQVVAAGRLFRGGIFLNAGDAIERLAEVDTIVFDKTGTLTLPETHVRNTAEIAPALLAIAARLALSSRHPLAAAVAREAKERRPVTEAEEIKGQGIRAVVDGVETRLGSLEFCGLDPAGREADGASLIAFRHGAESAVFKIGQVLRPDAVETIAALKQAGFSLHILSGDRPEAVAPIAAQLGVTLWAGGVKPAGKVAFLEHQKSKGRRVLMVGDGINDAAALAAADVSLAPITAADLSQAQADAVFLGADLRPVVEALQTARQARSVMMQNLWLAVVYNAIAVPIAMAGFVTPLIAAVAMSGSSILVTVNALRLRWPSRRPLRALPARSKLPAMPA
jgi:P-type Cu2+ transporter